MDQNQTTNSTFPIITDIKLEPDTEIKIEKFDPDEQQSCIIQTFHHDIFPVTKIKQEYEENYELKIPQNQYNSTVDDDYGEVEVLDEYIDEYRTMVTIKEEPKPQSSMSLRGVKINVSKMLGQKVHRPRAAVSTIVDPSTIQVPNCFKQVERPFKCKKCPLTFKIRRELTIHRSIHKKADFWCEKCGQKFRFQSSYHNHDCDFWCRICGKIISNKANLKIHMSYVHGVGEAKLFTCDLCGTTYKSKRNIDTHMKNHMESTPFNCAICGKGFSHAGALKIHMWNHRDLVDCEICKKRFKPRSLYYHIKRCRAMHEQEHLIERQLPRPKIIQLQNVAYKVIKPPPVYVIKDVEAVKEAKEVERVTIRKKIGKEVERVNCRVIPQPRVYVIKDTKEVKEEVKDKEVSVVEIK